MARLIKKTFKERNFKNIFYTVMVYKIIYIKLLVAPSDSIVLRKTIESDIKSDIESRDGLTRHS
jgi:hypothetical protein